MVKKLDLSSLVVKLRAYAAGGASISEVKEIYQKWNLVHFDSLKKPNYRYQYWLNVLNYSIDNSLKNGMPIGKLLNQLCSLIQSEEKQIKKVNSIEAQFALQAAIIFILPWTVVLLFSKLNINPLTFLGFILQLIGLIGMFLLIKKTITRSKNENEFLKIFISNIWIYTLSGSHIKPAIEASFNYFNDDKNLQWSRLYINSWKKWYNASNVNNSSENFSNHLQKSKECSEVISKLITLGAPAQSLFSEYYKHYEEESLNEFEDRISRLPIYLSLLFSFIFTPAFILIILSILWPQLIKIM